MLSTRQNKTTPIFLLMQGQEVAVISKGFRRGHNGKIIYKNIQRVKGNRFKIFTETYKLYVSGNEGVVLL